MMPLQGLEVLPFPFFTHREKRNKKISVFLRSQGKRFVVEQEFLFRFLNSQLSFYGTNLLCVKKIITVKA